MNTQALGTVRDFCVPNVPSVPNTEETGFCGDANGSSGDANKSSGDATSSAHALLTECEARGVRLELLPGDRLDVDAPAGMLTAELVESLRGCKADLLKVLARGVDDPAASRDVAVVDEDHGYGSVAAPDPSKLTMGNADPMIDPAALTCPACGSARIAPGKRRPWCLDCETDIAPVIGSQDRPMGDAPERIGNALAGDRHGASEGEWQEVINRDGRRIWQRADVGLQVIDWPTPCEVCGGVDRWQDLVGGWHCEACEPRTTGPRLRELAQRLREQYGHPADDDHGRNLVEQRRGRTWPLVISE